MAAGVSGDRSGRQGDYLHTAQHDGGPGTRVTSPDLRVPRTTAKGHGGTQAHTGLALHRLVIRQMDAGPGIRSEGPCVQIVRASSLMFTESGMSCPRHLLALKAEFLTKQTFRIRLL